MLGLGDRGGCERVWKGGGRCTTHFYFISRKRKKLTFKYAEAYTSPFAIGVPLPGRCIFRMGASVRDSRNK